jgi:hypothetical protein
MASSVVTEYAQGNNPDVVIAVANESDAGDSQSKPKTGGDDGYVNWTLFNTVLIILIMVVAIVALLYALSSHKATSRRYFYGTVPCDYLFSQQVASAGQVLNTSAVATGRIIFDASSTENAACVWALAGGGTTATGFQALVDGTFNLQYSLRLRTTNTGATGGIVRTSLLKNNTVIDGSVVEKTSAVGPNNAVFEDTWVSLLVENVPFKYGDTLALQYEAGNATQNWATVADSVVGSLSAAALTADHLMPIACNSCK